MGWREQAGYGPAVSAADRRSRLRSNRMNFEPAERIARAILYEGYLLYPYRPSALKNRYRWTFGCVFPPAWGHEPSIVQTECLVLGNSATPLAVKVRCFQLRSGREVVEREVAIEGETIGDLARREQ